MTEKEWSKELADKLREKGCFVQRIESGSTGRGIPDMFVIHKYCEPIWIENKIATVSKNTIEKIKNGITCSVKIPWRPGQLAWHNMVHNAMTVLTLTRLIGTPYVLVTVMNKYVGGAFIRNNISSGIATVRMFDNGYFYGIESNDTYMATVFDAVEHITETKWN